MNIIIIIIIYYNNNSIASVFTPKSEVADFHYIITNKIYLTTDHIQVCYKK